jgi:predicted RNA-binding protein with RPS1 domain
MNLEMKKNTSIDQVPLHLIFQTAWKKKWPSLIFALVLFIVICIKAFFISNVFHVSSMINIGYLTKETETGIQEQYIVNPNQEEEYVNSELLANLNLDDNCSAKALNLNNPQLKISCSGKTSKEANQEINKISNTIIAKHKTAFQRLVDYEKNIIDHKTDELAHTTQLMNQINANLKNYATDKNDMFINLFIELFKSKENLNFQIEKQKYLIKLAKPSSVGDAKNISSLSERMFSLLPSIILISVFIAIFTAFSLALSEISLKKIKND